MKESKGMKNALLGLAVAVALLLISAIAVMVGSGILITGGGA